MLSSKMNFNRSILKTALFKGSWSIIRTRDFYNKSEGQIYEMHYEHNTIMITINSNIWTDEGRMCREITANSAFCINSKLENES